MILQKKPLSDEQVEQFIEVGYVRIEEAFPRDAALAVQDFIWERLAERGVNRDDPRTWTYPMLTLQEMYDGPLFDACSTERIAAGLDHLTGEGRRVHRVQRKDWGHWPVNFSLGADEPWDVPPVGWHWDGNWFRHYLTSPEQGLLALWIFSEIGEHAGATLVAEGSHKIVARFLQGKPEGVDSYDAAILATETHPWLKALCGRDDTVAGTNRVHRFMDTVTFDSDGTALRVVETVGQPGDVYLCHPFLMHAAAPNVRRVPRFICNRPATLKEPMRFARPDGNYSPVEEAVRRALQSAG